MTLYTGQCYFFTFQFGSTKTEKIAASRRKYPPKHPKKFAASRRFIININITNGQWRPSAARSANFFVFDVFSLHFTFEFRCFNVPKIFSQKRSLCFFSDPSDLAWVQISANPFGSKFLKCGPKFWPADPFGSKNGPIWVLKKHCKEFDR